MTLAADLEARVLSRSHSRRIRVPRIEIQALLQTPEWLEAHERLYEGGDSLTVATEGRKLIAWTAWPVTPGEMARAYLAQVWSQPGATATEVGARATNIGFAWEAPIMATPHKGGLAYIDIHHAYWQLVSPYRPDDLLVGEHREEGVLDWLEPEQVDEHRSLRHAVVGCLFSNSLRWLCRGESCSQLRCERWSNPYLKRRCMSTLHAICWDLMSRFTVWAFMTDAVIVDLYQAEEVIGHLAGSWRVKARIVAEGEGAVWSTVSHRVGNKETMDLVNGTVAEADLNRRDTPPSSNLREVPVKWLRAERISVTSASRPS